MNRRPTRLDAFFHPDPGSPALSVLMARVSLSDPSAPEEECSWGRVTSGEFLSRRGGRWVAGRGGIACERIFGPLADYECHCGLLQGEADAGDTCRRCGVFCGPSALREMRFGHIELPGGVVHPALAPAIAEVLALSSDDVLAIAQHEGCARLRERLASAPQERMPAPLAAAGFKPRDLLLSAVPVVPPGDRPLVQAADPTVLALQEGPVNEAYRQLVRITRAIARGDELPDPDFDRAAHERMLQLAFEQVLTAVAGDGASDDARPSDAPEPVRQGPALPLAEAAARGEGDEDAGDDDDMDPEPARDPHVAIACLWLDDGRLLVQYPAVAFIVSSADGAILAEYATQRLVARSVDRAGRHVVFLGEYPRREESGELHDVALLDTFEGRWASELPSDTPIGTVVRGDLGEAFLSDARTNAAKLLDVASDRPRLLTVARDHRFVWAGGDAGETGVVVNVATGVTHVEVDLEAFEDAVSGGSEADAPEDETADGRAAEDEASASDGDFADAFDDDDALADLSAPLDEGDFTDTPDDESPEQVETRKTPAALALTPAGRWRFLAPNGTVIEDEHGVFQLGFPWEAAGFDPSGDRLAVVRADAICLVNVARPGLERLLDAAPLHRRLP